jgi:hypothetical protein
MWVTRIRKPGCLTPMIFSTNSLCLRQIDLNCGMYMMGKATENKKNWYNEHAKDHYGDCIQGLI